MALAVALTTQPLDPKACATATSQCRATVGQALLLERAIADATAVDLEACAEKLHARTATAAAALRVVAQGPPAEGPPLLLIAGAVGVVAVVFTIIGYAIGSRAPIVVR